MIHRTLTGLGRLPVAVDVSVLAWVMPAAAHDLFITAEVADDSVIVTVIYEDGSRAADAALVFSSDADTETSRSTLDGSGEAHLDLDQARGGLIVECFDGDGHSSYIILTPADLFLDAADE